MLEQAQRAVEEAAQRLENAKQALVIAEKQSQCKHANTDGAALLGETCLDCGLYLNNGW